jgi:hypothetical protein
MTDTHDTTPQADTPHVMVAIGADLIREAIFHMEGACRYAKAVLDDHDEHVGRETPCSKRVAETTEAYIARMQATAKALAEALPGDRV